MYQYPILDTPWHIISSTLVFLFGLWFAISQRTFSVTRQTAVILYLWHTAFCVFYLNYSLSNSADSTGYFVRSLTLDRDFGLGTQGIDYLTSVFSSTLGMSYLGVFLVNNIFGYVGVLAFAAALRQVAHTKVSWVRKLAYWIPFLPGASFWSAAIGKDSLTFMGASLAIWAFLNLQRRYPVLAITAVVFLLARPHMAALILFSALCAVILIARIPTAQKAGLGLMILPVLAYGTIQGAASVGLDTDASIQELNEVVEYRQSVNLEGGSSINIGEMNVAMRMFAFVFRPMFVDASGALGLVVSIENLLFIGLAALAIKRSMRNRSNLPRVTFWFATMFVALSWILLGNTTANMGLALRQKWMFLPMLLILFLSYAPAIKRKLTSPRQRRPAI